MDLGSRDGVVVRALTSHQCGPGSIPGVDAFSSGTPVFLPLQKPTFLNSHSTWKQRTKKSYICGSTEIPIYLLFFILTRSFLPYKDCMLLFYSCPHSRGFWQEFEDYWLMVKNETIRVTLRDIIVGIVERSCPSLNNFQLNGTIYSWECKSNQPNMPVQTY